MANAKERAGWVAAVLVPAGTLAERYLTVRAEAEATMAMAIRKAEEAGNLFQSLQLCMEKLGGN